MRIKFLQDYEGWKQGDIVETSTLDALDLLRQEIAEKYIPKQIKKYHNKMMTNYANK